MAARLEAIPPNVAMVPAISLAVMAVPATVPQRVPATAVRPPRDRAMATAATKTATTVISAAPIAAAITAMARGPVANSTIRILTRAQSLLVRLVRRPTAVPAPIVATSNVVMLRPGLVAINPPIKDLALVPPIPLRVPSPPPVNPLAQQTRSKQSRATTPTMPTLATLPAALTVLVRVQT